ncbi:MAG: hypothetical protein IJJ72_02985 [Bacteroidales bacterium]|nr:hypothetical protein [Bacteroidales bacterium]
MKRIVLALFTLILAIPVSGTEQAPERLVLNGKEYGMQYCPLFDLDTLLQRQINKRIGIGQDDNYLESTALWRAYIGCWSIADDYLYLDSIHTWTCKEENGRYVDIQRTFGYDDLCDLLAPYCHEGRIRAGWVSRDSIRVNDYSGEMLSYAHMGFSSRYSKEILCSFRKGCLRQLNYINHLFHDGIPSRDGIGLIKSRFPYDRFPELKGRGRIAIYIKDIEVDETARLTDCGLSMGGNALKGMENADELADRIRGWARQQILSLDWRIFEADGMYTLGYWSEIDLDFGREPKKQ